MESIDEVNSLPVPKSNQRGSVQGWSTVMHMFSNIFPCPPRRRHNCCGYPYGAACIRGLLHNFNANYGFKAGNYAFLFY